MILLFIVFVNSISSDCSALQSLAYGLGMSAKQPVRYASINSNCCTSIGIRCNSYGRVLTIFWASLNLNGSIKNTALHALSELTSFVIYTNQITGPPPSSFPILSKLERMDIGDNPISGSFIDFPPKLRWLHCDETAISGKIPTLPDSIIELRFGRFSSLTGSVYAKSMQIFLSRGSQINRIFIDDFSIFSFAAQYQGIGYCEITESNIYATQIAYLSDVCQITNVIANTECQVVSQIAKSLSMDIANSATYSLINSTCCSGYGITCDDMQHVLGINWSGMSLSGILDTKLIELLYSYLQSFNISNNSINGTFSDDFTTNLIELDVSNNRLTGEVGNIRFNKMIKLDLSRNQFSGQLTAIPNKLTFLNVSFNNFMGSIPMLPNNVQVDFSNNNFTGKGFSATLETLLLSSNSIVHSRPVIILSNLSTLPYFIRILIHAFVDLLILLELIKYLWNRGIKHSTKYKDGFT